MAKLTISLLFLFAAVASASEQVDEVESSTGPDNVAVHFYKQIAGNPKLQDLRGRGQEALANLPSLDQLQSYLPTKQQAQDAIQLAVKMAKAGKIQLYERLPVLQEEATEYAKKAMNVFQQVAPKDLDDAIAKGANLYAKIPDLKTLSSKIADQARFAALNDHFQTGKELAREELDMVFEMNKKAAAVISQYYQTAKLLAFEELQMTVEETKKLLVSLKQYAENVYVAMDKEHFNKLSAQGKHLAGNIYKKVQAGVQQIGQDERAQFLFKKLKDSEAVSRLFNEDNVVYVQMKYSEAKEFVSKNYNEQQQHAYPLYVRAVSEIKSGASYASGAISEAARSVAAAVYEPLHVEEAKGYINSVKNLLNDAVKPYVNKQAVRSGVSTALGYLKRWGFGGNNGQQQDAGVQPETDA